MESIYEKIGDFGLYQKLIFLQTCICSFIVAPPVVLSVFSEAVTKHRCYIPSCDEEDSRYEEDFLNFTNPFDHGNGIWSQCTRYSSTQDGNITCTDEDYNQDLEVSCSRWIYDRDQFQATTVTEYDLVCGRSWLVPISTSMYMIGMLFGSVTMGYVADRLGRRIGILICILIFSVSGLIGAMSPNYPLFLVLKFVTGIGGIAMFNVAFVMAVEFVGVKWRTFCGMMIEIPFSLGEASVGILAYYVRDFRYLIGTFFILSFLLIAYYWTMPESIRWLVAKGRREEALKIVQKAAKINGLDIPKTLEDEADISRGNIDSKEGDGEEIEKVSLLKLVSLPNMRKRTFILLYCWVVCTLVYYGISLSSRNLSGNLYINFIATMLIEIPGYIFVYFALDRIGRKGAMSLVFFISGAACIIAGFLPISIGWLIITMNLIGKFGISAAFGGIFVFTAELYPTEYRGVGIGACSTCARLGGIMAPFIADLSSVFLQLPVLIMGGASLIAAFAILLLPETVGAELPQTLLQSENFGLDQTLCYFSCCGEKKKTEE